MRDSKITGWRRINRAKASFVPLRRGEDPVIREAWALTKIRKLLMTTAI